MDLRTYITLINESVTQPDFRNRAVRLYQNEEACTQAVANWNTVSEDIRGPIKTRPPEIAFGIFSYVFLLPRFQTERSRWVSHFLKITRFLTDIDLSRTHTPFTRINAWIEVNALMEPCMVTKESTAGVFLFMSLMFEIMGKYNEYEIFPENFCVFYGEFILNLAERAHDMLERELGDNPDAFIARCCNEINEIEGMPASIEDVLNHVTRGAVTMANTRDGENVATDAVSTRQSSQRNSVSRRR